MNQFVMADPVKCIGCRTCEIACAVAHAGTNPLLSEQWEEFEFAPRLTVVKTAEVTAPVQCRHCEDAPCANVCPSGAIIGKGSSIWIDEETCIGCKTCIMACPFGAIGMVAAYRNGMKLLQSALKSNVNGKWEYKERVVASKCDLCADGSNGPECVKICPTNALRLVIPEELNESAAKKRLAGARNLLSCSGRYDI